MIDTQPVKGTVDAQGALKRMTASPVDIEAVKAGDLVAFNSPFGMEEVGVYKGTIAIREDYHEVWVSGRPEAARLIHKSKFTNHLPREA